VNCATSVSISGLNSYQGCALLTRRAHPYRRHSCTPWWWSRLQPYKGISQRITWCFQVRRLNHSARQPVLCVWLAENSSYQHSKVFLYFEYSCFLRNFASASVIYLVRSGIWSVELLPGTRSQIPDTSTSVRYRTQQCRIACIRIVTDRYISQT
jgi:hypothetical protein